MADNTMLQEAINAIRSGDKARARDLLTRLIKNSPDSAEYWIWMSVVVETDKERIYCLREALQSDPKNEAARRGLILFGAMPAGDVSGKPGIPHRSWSARQVEPPKPQRPALPISRTRLYIWSGAGFISMGLLIFGILDARNAIRGIYNGPKEAPTAKASATYLPTKTPEFPTATPTYVGPRPLVLLLSATYTPTPIYAVTPHPVSEAYKSGIRKMQAGDWAGALPFFEQVEQSEPNAVDAFYFMGEAYRLQGAYDKALEQYAKAIKLQPGFAPAYLGQARAKMASDPKAKPEADLIQAVQLDTHYGEAFLDLANYYLAKNDPKNALKYLQGAEAALPESAQVFLSQAQANLAAGNNAAALEAAKKANTLDVTLLDSYRVLAIADQANQNLAESIPPLETYLPFRPVDIEALVMVGEAYASQGQLEKASAMYSQAIQADPTQLDPLLVRGTLYLDQGLNNLALADFIAALKLDKKSFDANLGMGRALLATNQAGDAYVQLEHCRGLATKDAQRAAAFYWDAQSLEMLAKSSSAVKMWQGLLALPQGSAPAGWLATAQAHLNAILTPSPTPEITAPATTPIPG
ncbi:MAG TPA: tetratricopeptide repeat protein [Anaerolineaceae bacterium]